MKMHLIKPELVYDNQADGDPVIPEDLLNPFKEEYSGLYKLP